MFPQQASERAGMTWDHNVSKKNEEANRMKKTMMMLLAAAMIMTMVVPAGMAEEAEKPAYIPSTGKMLQYIEPVFYENTDGPTIGVTLVGVLQQDGLYFKDSDNDQELDPFEDWRLDPETRAKDLVSKMTLPQQAALAMNVLTANPVATATEDAYDANGNVIFDMVFPYTDRVGNGMHQIFRFDTVLDDEARAAIIRSSAPSATVMALYNNSLNQASEYAAVLKKQPAIPFTTLSNPMNGGYPGSLGMAAAVMGDVANGGDYSMIQKYAELDRQIWDAKGIDAMYGPQIDLVTDPRWSRNNGTYGEVPEVVAGIATALVTGYQNGTDGVKDGSVALTMKHFPGDGASENGFESHGKIGEWRIYTTPGSLEKYQLVGFQAAIDAGVAAIMPGYSRPTTDWRSAAQTYRGVDIPVNEEVANAFNADVLQTLLHGAMGFKGYINTDSGIVDGQNYGMEEAGKAERFAKAITAGSDVIGSAYEPFYIEEAVESGLLAKEALDLANVNRLISVFKMGRFENPYRDPAESQSVVDALTPEVQALAAEANRKSVVLMKNHDNVLPLTDTSKKVYAASYTGSSQSGDKETVLRQAFEAAGFTLAEEPEEADIVFLAIEPKLTNTTHMAVIDLVENAEEDERNYPASQEKTGKTVDATTLEGVKEIAKISRKVHEKGGVVIASISITSPWILTNLEPHVDGLIGIFGTSMNAQMDVLTGAYNPTGKLPVTMVSCNEVIAVKEVEKDGVVHEICASPNDVPGIEKDQYIDAEVLAQSPSGSYAYKDADGNVYAAWFGLSY